MTRTRLIVSLALGYVGLAAVRDLRESEAAFANEWAARTHSWGESSASAWARR